MKKRRRDFDISHPLTVNADHQEVEIYRWDPLGSYTGLPADIDDKPVQDADDL